LHNLMPPKAAKGPKVNVEKRRADYEKFISTREEEYDIWRDLCTQKLVLKEAFKKDINTTTYDITEDYDAFFNKMYDLVQAFKVKTKQKEFKYEYFRTFFYGGIGVRRDDSTHVEKIHDGLTRLVLKEDNDGCAKARIAFLAVYSAMDEVNDMTEETFPDLKKKMKEALTQFCKFYEIHIKKHHKPVYEVMADFLQVLKNALVSNIQYSMFEHQNHDPTMRKLNDWKDKALLEKLCTDLQECFRILLMTQYIKDNPSLIVLTNKFKIKGWEQNKIQRYFIKPLFETWINLRKEMSRLYVFGANHWVIPLGDNVDMVNFIKQLIEQELIAERMLGNDLKRDQLNFLFNTILYIFKTPAKDRLLSDGQEKEVVIDYVIPMLTVLRYLDHIVRITKAKREDVHKQERRQEFLNIERGQAPQKPEEKEAATPEEQKYEDIEKKLNKRDTKSPFISAVEDEDTPEDIEKFGRYWIWSDFFPENLKDEVLKGAEMLRNLNVAVRQDLADEYVNTAMKVTNNMHKGRAEIIKRKKEKAEPLNPADKVRPPFVWNHTDIIEVPHEYRANARPYDVYLGSRVKDMNNQIEFLAYELRAYMGPRWQELVQRVIGFFRDHRDEQHNEIIDVQLPLTF